MNESDRELNISEAAGLFLADMTPEERIQNQQ